MSESCSVVSNYLRPHGIYSPWNSRHQNTGVGNLYLLQEIFPTQGSKPGLLHCRQILYQLSHKRSPRILEWVAYPFYSRSSWPRNQTRVSCIAGGFFTNWVVREVQTTTNIGYLCFWTLCVSVSLGKKFKYIYKLLDPTTQNFWSKKFILIT